MLAYVNNFPAGGGGAARWGGVVTGLVTVVAA